MHDVLVIYKQISLQFDEEGNLIPQEGTPVHTLSYDEKPGVQATGTTAEVNHPELDEALKPFVYALPIEIEILQNQQDKFNQHITDYVRENTRNRSLS